MRSKTKIVHVVTGLDVGGAEVMMCRLLERHDRSKFDFSVVSLRPAGPLRNRIENAGLQLRFLDIGGVVSLIVGFCKLYALLKREKPEIVQTWMYHADLVGGIAARLAGVPHVVWNVQHSTHCSKGIKRTTRIATWLLAKLSTRLPDEIILCSKVGMRHHAEQGYDAPKMTYICNGAETDVFTPNAKASSQLRDALGIPWAARIIGTAGRFHAQKDYPTFFAAAMKLHEVEPDVHFVACGPNVSWRNPEVERLLAGAQFPEKFHLLGVRTDMHEVYPAFTVSTLCSAFGEGFPLTLGEAMACGVPCVATDVGDSAEIIDDPDRIAEIRDVDGLVSGWRAVLSLPAKDYHQLQSDVRNRVETCFSLKETVASYERVYEKLIGGAEESAGVEVESQMYELAS